MSRPSVCGQSTRYTAKFTPLTQLTYALFVKAVKNQLNPLGYFEEVHLIKTKRNKKLVSAVSKEYIKARHTGFLLGGYQNTKLILQASHLTRKP